MQEAQCYPPINCSQKGGKVVCYELLSQPRTSALDNIFPGLYMRFSLLVFKLPKLSVHPLLENCLQCTFPITSVVLLSNRFPDLHVWFPCHQIALITVLRQCTNLCQPVTTTSINHNSRCPLSCTCTHRFLYNSDRRKRSM